MAGKGVEEEEEDNHITHITKERHTYPSPHTRSKFDTENDCSAVNINPFFETTAGSGSSKKKKSAQDWQQLDGGNFQRPSLEGWSSPDLAIRFAPVDPLSANFNP